MVNTYLVSNTKLFYFNIRILVSLGLLVNNLPSFRTSTSRPFRQDQLSQKQRKIHYSSCSQRTSVCNDRNRGNTPPPPPPPPPETLHRGASDRVGVHVYNIQLFQMNYSLYEKHRKKGSPLQPTTSSQCMNNSK